MNTQNMSKNLQYTRRRLKLSQRQFVDSFLTSESGRALCSVPKLSNLENKGGKNLDVVCDILAGRLGLKGQDFSLGQTEFSGKLEEKLSQPEISSDRDLDDIVQEADRNSQLVAFIRTLSDYLTDLLLGGKLLPGDKIPSERALSSKFHVSRSTARETLKVLDVLGMIDIVPGKGTFIAGSSSDFFITPLSWAIYLTDRESGDVFFVRRAIEESTIEIACEKADEKDFAAIEAVLKRARAAMEAQDYQAFAETDIEFHMALVAASRNTVAVSLLTVLRKLSQSISQRGMASPRQLVDIYNEHESLFRAVKARNSSLALQILKDHFMHTHQRYDSNASRPK